MSDIPTPPSREVVAQVATILSNAAAPWALVSLVVILLFLGGCSVDQDRVQVLKGDLRALCENPITSAGKRLCDAYVADPLPEPSPE